MTLFDEVLGTRDIVNTPYATEVGAEADTGTNHQGGKKMVTKGNATFEPCFNVF